MQLLEQTPIFFILYGINILTLSYVLLQSVLEYLRVSQAILRQGTQLLEQEGLLKMMQFLFQKA